MGNMSNVKLVDTGVGIQEDEHRKNTNSLVDILNANWKDWSPTVAYVGTTVPLKSSIAKYTQIGSTVFFDYMQTGGANTGVTVIDLQVPLPLTPYTGATRHVACEGILLHGATYSDPKPFIDLTTPGTGVHCGAFAVTTSAYAIYISGRYEVA